MKRFIFALAFCTSLLVALSLFLFPPVKAKEDPIAALLSLPAPPPPNPLVRTSREHAPDFYTKGPPKDDAPIEDLIDYWSHQAPTYHGTLPTGDPSDRTAERLASELKRKPELASAVLKVLPDDASSIAAVKELYDRAATDRKIGKEVRGELKEWLRLNSSYFADDLARKAEQLGDNDSYVGVGSQDELLALTRHDFDKASPILDRLYLGNDQPASKTLATWALYSHALETDSLGDVDRYRRELMRMVEDRTLPDGVRDMANDALIHERDFSGRDEWSFSLFEDETLVNMPRFTMLTTLMMYSPPEKYVPKMLELIRKNSNPTVRLAAARNLLVVLQRDLEPELEKDVVTGLLPWLEDPKWISDDRLAYAAGGAGLRAMIVEKLTRYELPESVPGLIKVLDETERVEVSNYGESNANRAANAPSLAANRPRDNVLITNVNANSRPSSVGTKEAMVFPMRYQAIQALAKQKDPRAVPPLRRILPEMERYQRDVAVRAILACGGFTVTEQLDALDEVSKFVRAGMDAEGSDAQDGPQDYSAYGYNGVNANPYGRVLQPNGPEMKRILGQQLLQSTEISDDLAHALVSRIEGLDRSDPRAAGAYRRMILRWQNAAINLLLLSDVKRGIADSETILRLLAQRKDLIEKQPTDVFDLRTGRPSGIGIAACLIGDTADYDAILDTGDPEAKIALLACARLVRAPLVVSKVAANLNSASSVLTVAVERYLESEDSHEARMVVLSRHPGEARILGATSAFIPDGVEPKSSQYIAAVYRSIDNNSLYDGWEGSSNDDELKKAETSLQAEVKKDNTLVGIYAYEKNYVRIYNDRVIFSWDEDDSRYRERPLNKGEFDYLKTYLTSNNADALPPFLACGGAYCTAKELVMVGRSGGRRVYTNAESEFFTGLENYFAELKTTPATLRYALSRDIPGLEIILAADDLHVSTVWKSGDDLRVCASQTAVREKVKEDLEKIDEESEDAEPNDDDAAENQTRKADQSDKRRYEGYGWYRITGGGPVASVQPPDVEFVPPRDGLAVQPDEEVWKTRAAGIEVRASDAGLFKLAGGRLVQVVRGSFKWPVVTPNGRWAIVTKSGPEADDKVARIDLVSGREYPIEIEGYGRKYAQAYVPTLGKILVVRDSSYYDEGDNSAEDDDRTVADDEPSDLFLVDPSNGMVVPVTSGELRPASQQAFRPLQKASQPDEFWAAMPDFEKNETRLGIYNAKWLTFKAVRTIPKIKFNSMDMWVDETAAKIYFVYRGHLLALPLNQPK